MPFYEKRIVSGNMVEIEQFFSPIIPGKRKPRGARKETTGKDQAKLNQRNAEKQLMRKIWCNFDGARGDLFTTLTYTTPPSDEGRMKKDYRNFIDRANRAAAKKGTTFKCLYVPEEQSQPHLHLIVSGLSMQEITAIWGKGRVTSSILDNFNSYADLAAYLLRQEKQHKTDSNIENTKKPRKKHTKRWSGHNLKSPEVTITPITRNGIMKRTPEAPQGYTLLPGWVVYCDTFGHPCRRYAYVKVPEKPPSKTAKNRRKPK